MKAKERKRSKRADTKTTTYDDGEFTRLAIVVDVGSEAGSVDVVDASGKRLCQINLFAYTDALIVDVIDVDNRYTDRRALTFRNGTREAVPADKLVSVDFRKPRSAP